jgi:maltooligosyltrehalose trehalohydrolase
VATLVAAPAVPLLFMGEELAAASPFLYFTSHGDPALARAVAEGRRREFAAFAWQGEVPDPQDEQTFLRSKLAEAGDPRRALLYRDLIALRRSRPLLGARGKDRCRVRVHEGALHVERGDHTLVVLNLGHAATVSAPDGWVPLLASEDARYGGILATPGRDVPPRAAAVFRR